MSGRPTWWLMSKAIAQVTLGDRKRRRQFISALLAVLVGLFALGVWPLSEWLGLGLWRFLIFWGGAACLCGFILLMAVYDALSVIGEEKKKLEFDEDSDQSEHL